MVLFYFDNSWSLPSVSDMYSANIFAVLPFLLVLCVIYTFSRTYWKLRHIPGPFWARVTNLQRVSWVRSRRAHEIHMKLHIKHGDCVRFGPNMVSISDPAAIATVYPMRPGFQKVRARQLNISSGCKDVYRADSCIRRLE